MKVVWIFMWILKKQPWKSVCPAASDTSWTTGLVLVELGTVFLW